MTATLQQGRFNRRPRTTWTWDFPQPAQATRRRWLEPKAPTKRLERKLCAALDAGDDTAAWWVLRAPHRISVLRWAALADAAGAIDLFGGRPWPGLVAAAATVEALRRRQAYRFPKRRESPGRERFNWGLELAGVIYHRYAGVRSEAQLARAIGRVVDVEGMEDYCVIGLELLRERVKVRGRLSGAARRGLAAALTSKSEITRRLTFEVIGAARKGGKAPGS